MLLKLDATHPQHHLFFSRIQWIIKKIWKPWFVDKLESGALEFEKCVENIIDRKVAIKQIESILTNTIENIQKFDFERYDSGYYSFNLYSLDRELFRSGLIIIIDKHIDGFTVKSSTMPDILQSEYNIFKDDGYKRGEYLMRMFLFFLQSLKQDSLVYLSDIFIDLIYIFIFIYVFLLI